MTLPARALRRAYYDFAGVGLEVCRQLAGKGFIVLLSARDAKKAEAAADALRTVGRVEPIALNVDNPNSIAKVAAEIAHQYVSQGVRRY